MTVFVLSWILTNCQIFSIQAWMSVSKGQPAFSNSSFLPRIWIFTIENPAICFCTLQGAKGSPWFSSRIQATLPKLSCSNHHIPRLSHLYIQPTPADNHSSPSRQSGAISICWPVGMGICKQYLVNASYAS